MLCVVGIPLGLLLGWLSAKGILSAALSQLSPEMFLAQDTEQLQDLIAANSEGQWAYLAAQRRCYAGIRLFGGGPGGPICGESLSGCGHVRNKRQGEAGPGQDQKNPRL